jgi:uncharacterized protein
MAMLEQYEIYKDEAKEWRWRLVGKNGKVISDSAEGFKRRAGLLNNIKANRAAAVSAIVVERVQG